MPGGATTPKPDYALAGAILESTRGNIFVRMTGPRELVKKDLACVQENDRERNGELTISADLRIHVAADVSRR
jgi:hypothetical protein